MLNGFHGDEELSVLSVEVSATPQPQTAHRLVATVRRLVGTTARLVATVRQLVGTTARLAATVRQLVGTVPRLVAAAQSGQ